MELARQTPLSYGTCLKDQVPCARGREHAEAAALTLPVCRKRIRSSEGRETRPEPVSVKLGSESRRHALSTGLELESSGRETPEWKRHQSWHPGLTVSLPRTTRPQPAAEQSGHDTGSSRAQAPLCCVIPAPTTRQPSDVRPPISHIQLAISLLQLLTHAPPSPRTGLPLSSQLLRMPQNPV